MDTDRTSQPSARLTALAEQLGHLPEDDVCFLADVKPTTLEAWRKRGEGPAYVRAGNRFLYPKEAVSQWLQSRVRERKGAPVKEML